MCTKGNPKFSCATILSHSDDESLGSESDSREELFDSSLDTGNVSVNTELPMDSSHGSEEEEFDFLHLYEELSDYDFHRMMSVDDLTGKDIKSMKDIEHTFHTLNLCPKENNEEIPNGREETRGTKKFK